MVISHFSPSSPTIVVENHLEHPILVVLHLFQSFPTKVDKTVWYAQLCSFCTFSNLFPPKWSKMEWSILFIFQFFHLFSPKWSEMIWNAVFLILYFFQSSPTEVVHKNLEWLILVIFTPFPIFSYQSGVKLFRTPNFGSALSPHLFHQSGSK